jgi:hypothetical protein
LLDADDALSGDEFDDAVDEQEGIAVREEFLYGARVENNFHN